MITDKDTLKAWRLASQQLGAQRWQEPSQVVEWLGGVQAQDDRWARWSIGLRTVGCDEAQVERAIQARQIVRTWMFRGTLHFVDAGDLAWLTSLLAPGIIMANARRYRQLALGEAAFTNSQQVLQRSLEEKGALTRAQIKAHWERAKIPAEGQQVPYLLQRAALDGLICHGVPRDSEPTYVLVSEWIGPAGANPHRSFEPAQALGRLADRYFASRGPATRQDFAWWAGLSAQEARLALDSASAIAPVEMDSVTYWASGDPPPSGALESAALLPPFDDYLLGYKERSLALDPADAKRVNAGGGMPKATLMLNGDILGIWSYKVKKQGTLISIQLFRDLEAHERDLLARAASQLARFLSVPVETSDTIRNVDPPEVRRE